MFIACFWFRITRLHTHSSLERMIWCYRLARSKWAILPAIVEPHGNQTSTRQRERILTGTYSDSAKSSSNIESRINCLRGMTDAWRWAVCIVVGGIVYLMFLSTSKVGRIAILATFVYDNSTQPLIDGVYIGHVCTISRYDNCVR